jgi:nitroreductase
MHNSQPWRFRVRAGALEVHADPARRLPVGDPTGWGVRIACGAAAFNARLAFAAAGWATEAQVRPDLADPTLLVRLTATVQRPMTPAQQRLYAAITRRHSNRAPFWPTPIPADLRARLNEAARAEGAWLELIIGVAPLEVVATVTRAAQNVLERDERYRAEIDTWTRSDEMASDGVPASAGGPSPEPQDLLPQREFGGRPRAPGRDFEPEPLLAVLGVAGDTAADQVAAGMALQRVLLTATDAGLATSMLSQPIEVSAAREQLRLGLGRYGVPQMVLRIGYGQPGFPTPRRDVAEVIDDEDPAPE